MIEYFFSLPKLIELTIEQQTVLNEYAPIALSGGAGTGKSVVSIFRHLKNYENGNSSILITYTKTLQKYLFQSVKQLNPEASKRVHSANGCLISKNKNSCSNVYEIIIDEAQDLSYEQIETIKYFAKHISYGADFNQQLYEQKITKQKMDELFPNNESYHLEQNFRNTREVLNFTKALTPNLKISSNVEKSGNKPVFFVGSGSVEKILELIEVFRSSKENIAILVPFVRDVDYYYDQLKDKVECSYYHNKLQEVDFTISNIHITTFKSSKGLEFDTVIIPNFEDFYRNIEISEKTFVKENDYYVAFTRAKNNLFIISTIDFNLNNNVCDIEEF